MRIIADDSYLRCKHCGERIHFTFSCDRFLYVHSQLPHRMMCMSQGRLTGTHADPLGGPIRPRTGKTGVLPLNPDAWSLTEADRNFLKRIGVASDQKREHLIRLLECILDS